MEKYKIPGSSEPRGVDLDATQELFEFLQGKIPEGFYFVAPPSLTKEQAFSIIYYLQEVVKIIPDSYECCRNCGEIYDSNDSCSALCKSCSCPHNYDNCDNCSFFNEVKVVTSNG